MADPKSSDYYAQVDREVSAQIAADRRQVEEGVREIAWSALKPLIRLLEREFGRIAVSNLEMETLQHLLEDVASSGAELAKSVALETSLREARHSTGTVLNAVLTGIQIGSGKLPALEDSGE